MSIAAARAAIAISHIHAWLGQSRFPVMLVDDPKKYREKAVKAAIAEARK